MSIAFFHFSFISYRIRHPGVKNVEAMNNYFSISLRNLHHTNRTSTQYARIRFKYFDPIACVELRELVWYLYVLNPQRKETCYLTRTVNKSEGRLKPLYTEVS